MPKLLLFTVCVLLSGSLWAQPASTLDGAVFFGSDGLANIKVELTGTRVDSAFTNANGLFQFADLPNGDYTITPTDANYTFSPAFHQATLAGGTTVLPIFEAMRVTNIQEEPPSLYPLSLVVVPNPARTAATVQISIPRSGPAVVSVFDLLGRVLPGGTRRWLAAGTHHLPLDVSGLPAGVYMVHLTTPYATVTQAWIRVE